MVLYVAATFIPDLLWRDTFLSSSQAYLKHTEAISTLKDHGCRKYSFLKLTHLSQENNVLGAPASNRYAFLLRIPVFLQISQVGLFGIK
jgi:hypothetical protein